MFKPTLISSGSIVVSDDHIFVDTTARDAYFTTYPSELVDNLPVYVTSTSTLYQYKLATTSWLDITPVVSIQGDKGDKGDTGATGATGPQGIQGPIGPAGSYTEGNGINITNDVISVTFLDESGKVYITALPSSITGAVSYQGSFNPSSGAPSPKSQGYYYVSSGEGTISTIAFATGDWLVYRDEINWDKIGNSSTVVTWANITDKPSNITNIDTLLDGKASKTESDLTLYVYEDATGDADGSSKANAYTTLQAAIDAIPDVAQNVTVIVCKGSTNYLGQTTTIQKASVKSLTIQGEFYAYDACDANAVAGKIVDASADFSDFEVGDRVVCTHYSGTVGSSSIDDYFYATITEVGSGYVQTSEETKVPTTGWTYLINQTVFDGDDGSVSALITSDINLVLIGLSLSNNAAPAISGTLMCPRMIIQSVIIDDCLKSTIKNWAEFYYSAILGVPVGGRGISYEASGGGYVTNCIFVGVAQNNTHGIYHLGSCGAQVWYSGVFTCSIGMRSGRTVSPLFLSYVHIDSTITHGAYGYNITLVDCTNNAATPVYNLTRGGSIEEWDGEPLPSIADATGGQVLALKSDKSALEFATVDLDTLGAASSTTAAMTIYVDKAATGAGTGIDKTNAFTTWTAAIASLPAIVNHAIIIKGVKGSTPYAENIVIKRVVGSGSITLQGEYYWAGTCAASAEGKITLGSGNTGYADRAQIAAGDRIVAMKWSGTVEASAPSETIYDTVDSYNETTKEVTLTTNTGKTIDTTWTFWIVKTEIAPSSGYAVTITSTNLVSTTGLYIGGTPTRSFQITDARNVNIEYCYIDGFTSMGIVPYGISYLIIRRTAVISGSNSVYGVYVATDTAIIFTWSVINLTGSTTYGVESIENSYVKIVFSHIDAATTGLHAAIISTIYRISILNDGTTPINPASSPSADGAYII